MFVKKYYINPETLRYERVTLTRKQLIRYVGLFSFGLISLAILMRLGFERFYPTPREIIYQQENNILRSELAELNSELVDLESQLMDLRNRDDRFYRAILSLEPVSSTIRGAGTGGAERNQYLRRNLREPGMVLNVSQRIDKIRNKVNIQSTSLEKVYEEALHTQALLACKPSINPLSPADPYWLTSTYGYRNDPFTGKRTAHQGIDLAGPEGLDIHCTGAGTVVLAIMNRHGYGKEVVVDHGFGYTSRYAHLRDINVKKGQKVKRGEVIGTLGSTGRSTGPHLHYEIRKNNQAVNPFYFFYENLTSEEYMLLASRATIPEAPYQPLAMSQK
jgi:murein DD-endopeptidase MepM/ murein hydrolase activator NlpD